MPERFEGTKMIIRSRKLKDKQYHGQMKKDRMTNNEIQNITQKTNDLVTLTP